MGTNKDWVDDLCVACGQCRTPEGHDPCIANLPGAIFACCGHGNEDGYIKFEDGRILIFQPLQVDVDLPTVKVDDIPIFQLGGRRVFDFIKKRTKIVRYNTNVISRKSKEYNE